jgi:hypothetical protein
MDWVGQAMMMPGMFALDHWMSLRGFEWLTMPRYVALVCLLLKVMPRIVCWGRPL